MALYRRNMISRLLFPASLTIYFILQCCLPVNAISVMSVDLGSEWMKVAIVSPGVPMEIVLNKESKRKTPVAIAFKDGERTFGEDAQSIGVRFPKNCYLFLTDLLGKTVDNPIVKLYQERFPYYDIIPDPERRTVIFKHDEDTQFSVEELVGMMLHKAKEMAEATAEQPVTDVVITVPGYFGQAERTATLQAARLASLNVLQLINDYTAVALNYGIFRRKDFNETAQYIVLYDMGAASTTATVVSYQVVKTKERGFVETNPQLSILGVGYDRTLGGLEIQVRLQKHLAKKFDALKKTSKSVFSSPRSMAKLFKEAGRVKNILSANADHFAQVEGLIDEQDMRIQVTREELENLSKDLLERVRGPLDRALKASSLSLDSISQVILVGAGTRMPAVQDQLITALNGEKELGKSLNTDEAAVLGAAYRVADLSKGFKVKKFLTKDAVLFPIQVTFEREGESGSVKVVRRTLFGPMNPYPQKKIITFNKHHNDFSFDVVYHDLEHIPQNEHEAIGKMELYHIKLSGVGAAVDKHKEKVGSDIKGVKAHFFLDDSGVLTLASAELVVDVPAEPAPSAFSKIGETISSFFGGAPATNESADASAQSSTPPPSQGENKTDEATKTDGSGTPANATNTTSSKDDKSGDQGKPKVVTVKEEISAAVENKTVPVMSETSMVKAAKKLNDLDAHDAARARRESALNAVESFVFEIRNKLDTEQYKSAATEAEAEKMLSLANQIGEWVDEEGISADTATLEGKLRELNAATIAVWTRAREHHDRPEALDTLNMALNGSKTFLVGAKTASTAAPPGEAMFTPVEVETLEKAIKDIEEWKQKAVAEQATKPLHEDPSLTVKMIMEKLASLDREVKYLMNKAKIWRPKTPPKQQEPTKQDEASKNGTTKDPSTEEEKVIKVDEESTSEAPETSTQSPKSDGNDSTGGSEKPHTEL